MNFDYNEEQQLLADSVRRFIQKDYDFETRKKIVHSPEGYSAQAWGTLAEMGLTGIPFSSEFGGFGGGAVDLVSVMEAFGEGLVVEPYLATLLGAQCVARAGSDAQKKATLPAVVEGKLKMALAFSEKGARYELAPAAVKAQKAGGGWTLTGEKVVVLGAPAAAKLAVTALAPAGPSLFLVDAKAAKLKPYRTLDEMRAMKFSCDTTLEYLKTRKQFGVPIGTFQALQHRIVDMYVAYEQAKSMAFLACARVDASADSRADATERAHAVSAAKIKIADNARLISQEAIQLHGGMGMSEELKVSHSFRRLTVIAQQFGDADHHLERFARCG
jgi:alkylation response protein AidB-like acyl-CoA dehydrogenase